MSGKPAARQGDMTRKGLDIVQGSAAVSYTHLVRKPIRAAGLMN